MINDLIDIGFVVSDPLLCNFCYITVKVKAK